MITHLIFSIELIIFLAGLLGGLFYLYKYLRYLDLAPKQNQVLITTVKPYGGYFYLFIFIQLVAVGGLLFFNYVYYENINSASPKAEITPATVNKTQTPEPKKSPDPKTRAISKDVENNFLKELPYYKKGVLIKSEVSNTYSGIITSIDFLQNGTGELAKIKIKGLLGPGNNLAYTEKDLKNAKITSIINGKESPMTVKDLKIGDKIEVISVIDLLGNFPDNRIKLEITKTE